MPLVISIDRSTHEQKHQPEPREMLTLRVNAKANVAYMRGVEKIAICLTIKHLKAV